MAYERFSLRLEDYPSAGAFLPVLDEEIAKRTKLLAQAAKYNLEQCCGCSELFDLYLYKLQIEADQVTVDELDVPATHEISVTESGGSGTYYVLDGYYRKRNQNVEIMIIPPTGYGCYIEVNGDTIPVSMTTSFIHLFVMPDEDADVTIHYVAEGAGTAWKLIWAGRDVCVVATLAEALVTYEVAWDCDHPSHDISCPQCTAFEAVSTLKWQNEICIPESVTYLLEFEHEACNSSSTLYKFKWEDVVCDAPGVKTFELYFENETCEAPQVDAGKLWKLVWEDVICAAPEYTFEIAWEADEKTCASEDTDVEFYVMYPASNTATEYGYTSTGPYGSLSKTTLGVATITDFYASEADDIVSINFGGAQYLTATELKIGLDGYCDMLFVWNASTTRYEVHAPELVQQIKASAVKDPSDALRWRIDPSGFDTSSGPYILSAFDGANNPILDTGYLAVGYRTFPMCFMIHGGTDDGKTYIATDDLGTPGENVVLEQGSTISETSVTGVTVYKYTEP